MDPSQPVAPQPQPVPEPVPQPMPQPEPAPAPQPESAPAPEPQPAPQPAPKPQPEDSVLDSVKPIPWATPGKDISVTNPAPAVAPPVRFDSKLHEKYKEKKHPFRAFFKIVFIIFAVAVIGLSIYITIKLSRSENPFPTIWPDFNFDFDLTKLFNQG